MARKPTLSPSKLTTYLACPVKYRWTYLDSRGKWYLRARSYYSFGTTLHNVLQRFHDTGDEGVNTTEQALAAYEESWIDAGFSSAEEMAEAYGEGKMIVERHVEEELRRPVTAKTLFLERLFRTDLGEFDLIGRLDRVDELEDGSLEIIDYKTGRQSVDQEEVRSDLAMGCYQLLLRRKFPDKEVKATIIALRTGVSASAAMSALDLEEFEADLRLLGHEILHEDYFELFPKIKPLCYDPEKKIACDFLPLCKKHQGFAEEFAAAEE